MSKKKQEQREQEENNINRMIKYTNSYAKNKAKLDEMIKEASTLFRFLRDIAEKDFVSEDSVKILKELQTNIGSYQQCLSQMEEGENLELSGFLEKVPLYKGTLTSLTSDLKNSVHKKLNKMNKHADELFKRWYAERIVAGKSEAEVQPLVFKFNESSSSYLKFTDSIILDILKASLNGISNYFLSSYGHAVHSVASFRDDKIEGAYLKATSPMEVRVASESLERKLGGIISNERPIIEDYLDVFPVNIADVSRRQKKKFLNESLTPKINVLYREMQLVCSSGMKYFDMKRELRADAMYLERSLSFIQRIQLGKGKTCSPQESQEIKEIAEHKNYLEQHKELEGMVLVKREVERYQTIYSQVIDDAKKLLDEINRQGAEIRQPHATISTPQKQNAQMQPQADVDSVVNHPQTPKLIVIEGYATVKGHGDKEGVKGDKQPARRVEYVLPQVPSAPSVKKDGIHTQQTDESTKAQSQQPNPVYNINTTLVEIHEPNDSTLKAFYNLLHRRDPKGRIWLASPTELAQMIGLVELDIKGDNGRQYVDADKLFFRDVVGYLHNPETLMYGAIKGSEITGKYAQKLVEEMQKRM